MIVKEGLTPSELEVRVHDSLGETMERTNLATWVIRDVLGYPQHPSSEVPTFEQRAPLLPPILRTIADELEAPT